MLISHTDIPFGGNVVSSLFKFHNVPWAHHASVWVRVEDCPMGGYTLALPLRAPFVTDSSAAGARESLRPQTCRTKSRWDPPRRMDPARWRWRWEPLFRCSGPEDVAQWIFNVISDYKKTEEKKHNLYAWGMDQTGSGLSSSISGSGEYAILSESCIWARLWWLKLTHSLRDVNHDTPMIHAIVHFVATLRLKLKAGMPKHGNPNCSHWQSCRQDIWKGAVGGVPVHERSILAQECVVGDAWHASHTTVLQVWDWEKCWNLCERKKSN